MGTQPGRDMSWATTLPARSLATIPCVAPGWLVVLACLLNCCPLFCLVYPPWCSMVLLFCLV